MTQGMSGMCKDDTGDGAITTTTLKDDLWMLATNGIYVCIVFAYAAQTFVTGAFGFYGIQYVQRHLGISDSVAGMSFGGVTVVCGFAGTAMGGMLLDRVRRSTSTTRSVSATPAPADAGPIVAAPSPAAAGQEAEANVQLHHEANANLSASVSSSSAPTDEDPAVSIQNAMLLLLILSAIALPCCLIPFLPAFSGPASFFSFIAAGELMLFGCYAPINSAILWAVPYRLGPLAVAMSSVGLHVLGDAISAPILGFLLDRTHNDWNLSFFFVALWLSWTIVCFAIGWRLSKKNVAAINILEPLITDDNVDKHRPQAAAAVRIIPIDNSSALE